MSWFKKITGGKKPARSDEDTLKEELEAWQIITVKNDTLLGEPAVIRLRMRKPALPEGRAFACAIEITWPYDGNGNPPEDINQKQVAFENALDDLSWMNGFSELVQVSTGMGKKEWLYYTSDQERFMREFNALLAGHENYPLQIDFYDDPEWQIWSDVVASVQSKRA